MAILAIVLLVAAHIALLGVVSRSQLFAPLLAALVAVAVAKYAWWRLRR